LVRRKWSATDMNDDKTQALICSLARDAPINEPVKLLGFMLDGRLAWNEHLAQTSKRLSRVCYLFLKLRRLVPEPYLVTAYHALFHCHIGYGILLWGHSAGVEDILKLQKKAVRIITSSDRLAHCKPLFARLQILTVYGHYILACLLHVKNHQQDFQTGAMIHNHNTRQKNLLNIPRVRLTKTQKGYTTPFILHLKSISRLGKPSNFSITCLLV
jgi:hypothetical protein